MHLHSVHRTIKIKQVGLKPMAFTLWVSTLTTRPLGPFIASHHF